MELVYVVRSGSLVLSSGSRDILPIAKGYSGFREYRNNPAFETRRALGPIPRGIWLVNQAVQHPRLGPVALSLEPENVPSLSGRSEFFIHGDNARGDFSASTGCIIVGREARDFVAALWRLGVRRLRVE